MVDRFGERRGAGRAGGQHREGVLQAARLEENGDDLEDVGRARDLGGRPGREPRRDRGSSSPASKSFDATRTVFSARVLRASPA